MKMPQARRNPGMLVYQCIAPQHQIYPSLPCLLHWSRILSTNTSLLPSDTRLKLSAEGVRETLRGRGFLSWFWGGISYWFWQYMAASCAGHLVVLTLSASFPGSLAGSFSVSLASTVGSFLLASTSLWHLHKSSYFPVSHILCKDPSVLGGQGRLSQVYSFLGYSASTLEGVTAPYIGYSSLLFPLCLSS